VRVSRRVAVGLAGFAVLGAGAAVLALLQAPPVSARATLEPITTSGVATTPALSPDASVVAYYAGRCNPDALGCAWDLVWQDVNGGPPLRLVEDYPAGRMELGVNQVRWLDHSTLLIHGDKVFTTDVISRTGGTLRVLPGRPIGRGVADTVYTRTGADAILAVSAASGQVADTLELPGPATALEGSPNGRWLAAVITDASLQAAILLVLDRAGRVVDTIAREVHPRLTVRWSPASDGLLFFRVAAVNNQFELVRQPLRASTGRARGPAEVLVDGVGANYLPAFDLSRDGRTIAFVDEAPRNEYLRLPLPADGDVPFRPIILRVSTQALAFTVTPDGTRILFWTPEGRGDSLAFRVYQSPTDRDDARPVGPLFSKGAGWWPTYDGRFLVYETHEGALRWTILDLSSGQVTPWRRLAKPDGDINAVAGGVVWTSSDGRSISLFDSLGTEHPFAEWGALGARARSGFAVAPDGRRAAVTALPQGDAVGKGAARVYGLSIPDRRVSLLAATDSLPASGVYELVWIDGGPILPLTAEATVGARLMQPDGRGGFRTRWRFPVGIDYVQLPEDGRYAVTGILRSTSNIVLARLPAPR
jgi:hypothetical protein